MTIRFTTTKLIVDGKTVVSSKDERKQLALTIKHKLGMK